jgi:hypothetical protein
MPSWPVRSVLEAAAAGRPLAPPGGVCRHYYQRSLGEIAPGLPPALRDMTAEQLARRLAPKKLSKGPGRAGAQAVADAAQRPPAPL